MVINAVAFDHAVSVGRAGTLGMGQPLNGRDAEYTCGQSQSEGSQGHACPASTGSSALW